MTRYRATDPRGVEFTDEWSGEARTAEEGDVFVPLPDHAERLVMDGRAERVGRWTPPPEEGQGPLGPCGDCGKGIGHAPEPMLPGHPDGIPICGACRARRKAAGTLAGVAEAKSADPIKFPKGENSA